MVIAWITWLNGPPYITQKDYKENVDPNPTFRLINPAKSDLEKGSTVIRDEINF